jgi:hypothetical protein
MKGNWMLESAECKESTFRGFPAARPPVGRASLFASGLNRSAPRPSRGGSRSRGSIDLLRGHHAVVPVVSIDLLRGHHAVVPVVGDPQLPMRPHRHTCAGALRHHPRAAPGGSLAGLRPDLAGRRAAPARRL